MSMTDTVGDMLTRIRNASKAKHEKVDIPSSNLKFEIVKILKEEGYVKNFKLTTEDGQPKIRVYLKYGEQNSPVINDIKRVSKPGIRVYSPSAKIPRVQNGYGICVVSTSKGIMTDRAAKKANVGGEILFTVC